MSSTLPINYDGFQHGVYDGTQSYHPVVDECGRGIAYISTEGQMERLVYQAEPDTGPIVISSEKYFFDPNFCAGYLFWVEGYGDDWRICLVPTARIGQVDPTAPFEHVGRPLSIASFSSTADQGVLVWEERDGVKTIVRMATIGEASIGPASNVTDGHANAYDPGCCVSGDLIYLAYTSFNGSTYSVILESRDASGRLVTGPTEVSNESRACVHPSLYPRRQGGVWVSFCLFPEGLFEEKYVRHHRRRAQHQFFGSWGQLRAGIYDGDMFIGVQAPSKQRIGAQGGWLTAWIVYGSDGGGRSQILEDSTGRAHIVFRHFVDRQYPNLSLTTLFDDHWGEPVVVVERALHELPISLCLEEDRVALAYARDHRSGRERLDTENTVEIGRCRFPIPVDAEPKYETRQYYLPKTPSPSIKEPRLDRNSASEWLTMRGQIHTHSSISVCVRMHDRDLHTNYRFFQDVMGCLFCGVTDHAYNQWAMENVITRKTADYYYFPGKFVALQAYEWTGSRVTHEGGPFGHVNVLSFEENGLLPFYTPTDPTDEGGTLQKLWRLLGDRPILTIPHHVQDNMHPYFWHFHHEKFEPVVEIFQDARGAGEIDDGPGVTNFIKTTANNWIVTALNDGKRLGLIAGGDHMGVSIACVLVKDVTRSGLHEAMAARRTFASTGVEARLEFTCNGEIMGREIDCEDAEFVVDVRCTSNIRTLQIIRDGVVYAEIPGSGTSLGHVWSIAKSHSGEYWYVRTILEDGEVVWSSPIWLV